MDQSLNYATGGTEYDPTARPSLHKKRSLVRVRSDSINKKPRPVTTATFDTDGTVSHDVPFSVNATPNGPGPRKGSLRNVVRKIFGRSRSSRLVTPVEEHATPPRHKYHKSEPPSGLSPPREQQDYDLERGNTPRTPQRVLSAPLRINIPPIQGTKVRSPYAVEFPKSARLKPLDISSPFEAPNHPLRRRKTLPSILIAGDDAVAIAAAAKKSEMPPMPTRASAEEVRQTPTSEIGLAISGIKEKRRSRSAGGMRTRDSGVATEPERKRSEEIRFWRESYQGSVLRASGFTVPFSVPPPEEKERDDRWQRAEDEQHDPLTSNRQTPEGLRITSHSRQDTLGTLDGSTQLNFRSNSALDAQTSRDLEERVAQLESNLQFFQRSLQKLQADRNRRTVIVGDYPSTDQRKSWRTPSMLADDLRVPSDCVQHDSAPESEFCRPRTAPQPRSPIADYPPVPHLPGQGGYDSPDASPAASRGHDASRKSPNPSTLNSSVAFKSLYQMLADERSARRRLETKMRTLHNDIQDLQQQVSSTSYSHRNSYMLSHEATIASSRLRELLRETENHSDSLNDTPRKGPFVSRFSGSTTAGVREIDELDEDIKVEDAETPHEEYKTPREEQSPFKFNHDAEMF